MLPANNKGVGMSAGFPDVCMSPVLGLFPFPNFHLNATMFPFSFNVWFSMMPALNLVSFSPITLGDQLGTLHPTFMGQGRHTVGNPRVLINFVPATSLLSPQLGNNFNCMLGLQVMPSLTNVFLSYRAEGAGDTRPAGASMPADIDGLLKALDAAGSTAPVERAWLGPGVGYVRVRRFSLDVPARVHTAVGALQEEGLDTLVLDLRGNPGGDLTAALELAGEFLEPGSVLCRALDADGDETVYHARHESPCRTPLWLLVDGGTASAAELFAGCLKWHGRAVVAGSRTYGKGTALTLAPDPATRAPGLVPAATLLLPGGEPIQGVGVLPDIELGADSPVSVGEPQDAP